MNAVAKKWIALVVGLLLICMVPKYVTNTLALQYMINMLIFAYFATAWNIIGGYAGQLALGNGVYVGIGAYVSAVLFTYEGVSPWVGMLVGGVIAALIALVIGKLTFRLSGTYFAMATLAVLHIIRMTFISNNYLFGYKTKGALSFPIKWRGGGLIDMQFVEKGDYFYLILALLVAGIAVSYWVKNSKMGFYLQAIDTNPEAASSLGVDVIGMKLQANMISAFLTAVGGAFYAQFLSVIDPSSVLGYDFSVQILMFAIIGGKGTLVGPVLAAFLMVPLKDILNGIVGASVSGLAQVVYGLVLMVFIYFLPKGLWPSIIRLYENAKYKRRAGMSGATDDKGNR